MFYYIYYNSPIGKLTIASNEQSIIGLWFNGQKYYMDILKNIKCKEEETAIIKETKHWLDKYFNKEKPSVNDIPLEFIGSDFRIKVWDILLKIPYGQVMTYGDIAKEIAKQNSLKTMSAQAIGGAVGHNPISIIVPCHRVISSNGNLTGYAGGIDKKEYLLNLEGYNIKNQRVS